MQESKVIATVYGPCCKLLYVLRRTVGPLGRQLAALYWQLLQPLLATFLQYALTVANCCQLNAEW